jgi:hypothetical protein
MPHAAQRPLHLCVQGFATDEGSQVWMITCHPDDDDPMHRNEAWSINANGTVTEIITGMCLDSIISGNAGDGNAVVIRTCNNATSQQWVFDNATGMIHNGNNVRHGVVPMPLLQAAGGCTACCGGVDARCVRFAVAVV